MPLSNKSFALLFVASLAAVASATDITTLNGTQGWVLNGTSGGGSAFIGGSSADGDGSLHINGDRARVSLGYGDEGGSPVNLGTLGQLGAGTMSFDFFRDPSSVTGDDRYNVAVKVFLSNGMSLSWENGYNASIHGSTGWNTNYQIGGADGLYWLRDPFTKTSFTNSGQQYTLGAYAGGQTVTGQSLNGGGPTVTSSSLSGNLSVIGLSFAVGSGVNTTGNPGTFVGAVDNLKVNFGNGGSSYAYNFRDPSALSAVPGPAAVIPFALGFAKRLRRRKRA